MRAKPPAVEAVTGLVVEDAETGWCGAVTRTERMPGGETVTLEDRFGRTRVFPLGAGFLLEGAPVVLVRPRAAAHATRPSRTASGSVAVHASRARVALASRIYVEGRHDAELVERVWGEDLRVEGIVVEYLDGIDDLPAIVRDFRPARGRRLGVLVDHLVPGSKESRIAGEVAAGAFGDHVLVVGHPFIDIWQAVKASSVGIAGWPSVPRGRPWKEGVVEALGWNLPTYAAWRRILASVSTYADLEPALLGRIEQLIDFVSEPPGA